MLRSNSSIATRLNPGDMPVGSQTAQVTWAGRLCNPSRNAPALGTARTWRSPNLGCAVWICPICCAARSLSWKSMMQSLPSCVTTTTPSRLATTYTGYRNSGVTLSTRQVDGPGAICKGDADPAQGYLRAGFHRLDNRILD